MIKKPSAAGSGWDDPRCHAGVVYAPVDMLLCLVAIHHDWEIFTTDRDFVHYQSVLKIKLLG
jgi:predicted nucleic acid-binding protein